MEDKRTVVGVRRSLIDRNNFLREFIVSPDVSQGLSEGALTTLQYQAAVNSALLYAVASNDNDPRVGYQAANAPDFITETFYGASIPHWIPHSFS